MCEEITHFLVYRRIRSIMSMELGTVEPSTHSCISHRGNVAVRAVNRIETGAAKLQNESH
jgi:hypothetical protein